MFRVIYTKAVDGNGRYACVGGDKMTYEYADVPDEETFQKLKNEIVEELKKEDSPLVKASFYNEKGVPFEISFDDINEEDEYCLIDAVNGITLKKLEESLGGMTKGQWELFNGSYDDDFKVPEDLAEADENSDPLYDYLKSIGPTLLK